MEKVTYVWKSSILDREPSTQYNDSDFVQFLTKVLTFEFGSIRQCLASLEKSIGEFSRSQWFIKNEYPDVAKGL